MERKASAVWKGGLKDGKGAGLGHSPVGPNWKDDKDGATLFAWTGFRAQNR